MVDLLVPPSSFANCTITPLIGGEFYNELVKLIDESSQSIYSIQYQWKWNVHERHSKVQRLGAAIIRAKARKCEVSVLLNTESPRRNLSVINRVTGDQLAREGVQVRLLRTNALLHTKLWIFDHKICLVGSHNISSRALSANEEVSVKIESKEVAGVMYAYFNTLWQSR